MADKKLEVVAKWGGAQVEQGRYIFDSPRKARLAYEELVKVLPDSRVVQMLDEVCVYDRGGE